MSKSKHDLIPKAKIDGVMIWCNHDELVDTDKLIPFPRNPNIHPGHQIEALAKIIKHQGWRTPITVSKRSGFVVRGHGRLMAAKKLELSQVPVDYQDYESEASEWADLIADNKIAELASTDDALLRGLMDDIKFAGFDMNLTGFGEDELIDFFGENNSQGGSGNTDPDEVPDPPVEPKSKLGDLFQIGRHRLLCGDSTKREDVERLMSGKKADICFTDPPYGIKVVKGSRVGGGGNLKFGKVGGKNWVESKTYHEIINDDSTNTAKNTYDLCKQIGILNIIFWGGNYFTDFLPPSPCWIIWDKENTGNFADVEIAWASYQKGAKLYRWMWNGLARKGDRNDELVSRVHPTQNLSGCLSIS